MYVFYVCYMYVFYICQNVGFKTTSQPHSIFLIVTLRSVYNENDAHTLELSDIESMRVSPIKLLKVVGSMHAYNCEMNISILRTIGISHLCPKSGGFAVITITDLIVIMLTSYKSRYDLLNLVEDLNIVLKGLT